jgi:hypothetical protein
MYFILRPYIVHNKYVPNTNNSPPSTPPTTPSVWERLVWKHVNRYKFSREVWIVLRMRPALLLQEEDVLLHVANIVTGECVRALSQE